MATASRRLPRADRLRWRRQFQTVSARGRRIVGSHFILLTARREAREPAGGTRLGITVSRRVGGAVVRNRVKRCIREWFRRERDALPAGLDVVVIARRAAAGLSCPAIGTRLSELAGRVEVPDP